MSNNNQDHKWVIIWSCEDGMEAQLIKNLLEIENIPVKLGNINSNNLFPDTGISKVKIYVPDDYAENGKKIIEENFE